jgi:hypothetical protein
MASILKVDTITGVTTAGSIAVTGEGNSTTTNLQQGLAKAWVNFVGSSSGIPIGDSFNVSGNTDNGTGDYTITYSNAMGNGNYSLTGVGQAGGGSSVMALAVNSTGGLTTASARIFTKTGSPADSDLVTSTISGDLA